MCTERWSTGREAASRGPTAPADILVSVEAKTKREKKTVVRPCLTQTQQVFERRVWMKVVHWWVTHYASSWTCSKHNLHSHWTSSKQFACNRAKHKWRTWKHAPLSRHSYAPTLIMSSRSILDCCVVTRRLFTYAFYLSKNLKYHLDAKINSNSSSIS